MALFGTSGIRMPCPEKLDAAMAMKVGAAAAKAGGNGGGAGGRGAGRPFVVGYDGRRTGQMLKSAISAGAASVGAGIIDLGLCATPTLALHTQSVSGMGAMITASHNPPEYNGIKLFENGREAPKEVEALVERAVEGDVSPELAEWKKAGQTADGREMATQKHMNLALSLIDSSMVKRKNPKIALDCGNAAACALMPMLLEKAGCTVVAINSSEPGNFTRGLEPTEANLMELSSEIVSCGADFGIAHDGDADRAIILDENGRMLGLDAQLAIAVREMMEKNQKAKQKIIVSTVESSLSLREIVEGNGWKLEITPVGSLYVAERMRKIGACFGGEPCGEYIFPSGVQMPDGLMAGAFFAEIFARKGKLSKLAEKIKTYPMLRERLPCANEKKGKAMEKIEKNWPFSKPKKEDGLRSEEKWGTVLVRPSGTEPIIRITLEAKNEGEAKKRMGEIMGIARKAL